MGALAQLLRGTEDDADRGKSPALAEFRGGWAAQLWPCLECRPSRGGPETHSFDAPTTPPAFGLVLVSGLLPFDQDSSYSL